MSKDSVENVVLLFPILKKYRWEAKPRKLKLLDITSNVPKVIIGDMLFRGRIETLVGETVVVPHDDVSKMKGCKIRRKIIFDTPHLFVIPETLQQKLDQEKRIKEAEVPTEGSDDEFSQ